MTTKNGIPGHVSPLVRDVASALRDHEESDVYADLVSEGGMEFASEIIAKAKAFNESRGLS